MRTLIIVLLIWSFGAVVSPARDFLVYIGTYTNTLSQGIYVSRLNADTGKLTPPELAATVGNPNFVNISPDEKHLYSSSSVSHPDSTTYGEVSAYAIDKSSGRLTLLNREASGGNDPCYVSVDSTGKVLLLANYDNGSVKAIPLKPDGRLGFGGAYIQNSGHGPNTARQQGPHAHFLGEDPTHRFVLECDLGADKVMVYRFDPVAAGLLPNRPAFAAVPPGSGPRHLVFSHDGHHVYVVNEMGCTVTTFNWDANRGVLAGDETISALPAGVSVEPGYTGAEILISRDGRFVYVTLRGHDSVSVFSVAPQTGRLTLIQNVPSGGKLPRGLGIDPTGHWLLTGHQQSNNAVEFAIDQATGKLTPTGVELQLGSPVDFKFIPAN